MEAPKYLQLRPDEPPPPLDEAAPFKAVVVIDADVISEWQMQISDWLVRAGCRYMMAWGKDCGTWDSSVDEANLAIFDYGDIPEDHFVMTTWHDGSLEKAFLFSQFSAEHPSLELEKTYIVHVSLEGRATEMLKIFRDAQQNA